MRRFIGTVRKSQGPTPPVGKTYVGIPAPVTFTDPHTLTTSAVGVGIKPEEVNGKSELYIGSDFNQMQLQGLVTPTVKLRSLNVSDPSVYAKLGIPGATFALDVVNTTPNLELHNIWFKDASNNIKLPPDVTLKSIKLVGCVIQNAGFAGLQINQSITGRMYGDVTICFCWFKGNGGEHIYAGHTLAQTTMFEGITRVYHCYFEASGRESVQFNGHRDLRVENLTAYFGGLEYGQPGVGAGQSNCFQWQNIYDGYMKKCIFWNFKAPAMIATDSSLFEDCFLHWTLPDREMYLQSMTPNYTNMANPGGTLEFNRCTFYNPAYTKTWIARAQGGTRNVIFRDCIFPASVNPAAPIKIDYDPNNTPYTVQVINPTYTNNPPLPVFGAPPEAAYADLHKVITDDYYHTTRQMGARTPVS